jgi:hypothetical protein
MTFASTTAFIGIGNRASLNLHFHGANGRIAARIDLNETSDGYGGVFTESWDEHIDAFLRQYLTYWELSSTDLPPFISSGYRQYRYWLAETHQAAELRWGSTISQEIKEFIEALCETLDCYTSFEYGCEQFQAICRLVMQINQTNGA